MNEGEKKLKEMHDEVWGIIKEAAGQVTVEFLFNKATQFVSKESGELRDTKLAVFDDVAVHALYFPSGLRWDCITGFMAQALNYTPAMYMGEEDMLHRVVDGVGAIVEAGERPAEKVTSDSS